MTISKRTLPKIEGYSCEWNDMNTHKRKQIVPSRNRRVVGANACGASASSRPLMRQEGLKKNPMPTNSKSAQRMFLRIGDTEYDVTEYDHPGGSVIKYAVGAGDATTWFNEFHANTPMSPAYCMR